ncbi:MAG: translation initiation factor IF-2 subunit beta [Candidatus ainarchaeum sp.]|nr:translation initiation factor IF-2 subunit beta [Candidatus ainarchaeum sp.]
MENYDKLLDKAFEKIKSSKETEGRFELIEPDSLIQGKKTLIKNLQAIAKNLNRDINHIAKYFAKETGAVGNLDGGKLILNSAILQTKIKLIYNNYLDAYVFCKQCKKPDTKFLTEKGAQVIKCEACGAMTSVKKI